MGAGPTALRGTTLLERSAELDLLETALSSARSGHGSVVLVAGEAGAGKSSLVHAFATDVGARARVLTGACDDLVTPRTLGAIRDAFAGCSPHLDQVLAEGTRDDLLDAVVTELGDMWRATVLVIEDVHWADDATLDLLGYVARRIAGLPTVLVVSYRDDEVGRDHPAQRLLGQLSTGPTARAVLAPLTTAAVATLAGTGEATAAELHRLTGGNPFYVTEVLAGGEAALPATVVDAVLARVHRLPATTRAVLDLLAVVPSHVDLRLARDLLGDLGVLAEAERRGVVEIRPDAVAFRHELARRAIESSLTAGERMHFHARVLEALTARDEPDLTRMVHHAVEAGDDATVVDLAPRAAAQAAHAGSYAQEITFRRLLLERAHLLEAGDVATLHRQLAAAFWVTDEGAKSLEHGTAAIALREELGDPTALGEALTALAPTQWALTRTHDAQKTIARAVELLEAAPETAQRTLALLYRAALFGRVGLDGVLEAAEEAADSARRTDVPELIALSHTYLGRARVQVGEHEAGLELMRAGVSETRAIGAHTSAVMAYGFLAQDLFDLSRFEECEHYLDEAFVYATECGMWFLLGALQAFGHGVQAVRGEWDAAVAGLRRIVEASRGSERGSVRFALPCLAGLLARRGAPDAPALLRWAQDYARRADSASDWWWLGLVELETAWLTDSPDAAGETIARLEELTARPGRETQRGELHRWKRRLGLEHEVPSGCPPLWSAGISGRWREAADRWEALGAPYQQALELLDSGETEPTLRALEILEDLGAEPSAQIARRRLRALGHSGVRRGPTRTTRTNPAGLTERQIDVLRLLAEGLTNAEIADRLVISEKTTDHHVSAVLAKLDVPTRRDAAREAWRLGVARERRRTPRD